MGWPFEPIAVYAGCRSFNESIDGRASALGSGPNTSFKGGDILLVPPVSGPLTHTGRVSGRRPIATDEDSTSNKFLSDMLAPLFNFLGGRRAHIDTKTAR